MNNKKDNFICGPSSEYLRARRVEVEKSSFRYWADSDKPPKRRDKWQATGIGGIKRRI